MEESRLKPMVENYDQEKFKRIYDKTQGLRRKLVAGIDHRRFGYDKEEILSWFDVKFIYAYNKYCLKYNEDILLGHMIRAMQFFKCRVIKSAYTVKYSQNIIEYTGQEVSGFDDPHEERDFYYNQLKEYLQQHLSDNAYYLLQLQINPPPYILSRLTENSRTRKIPDELIIEYLDLGFTNETHRYIKALRREIDNALSMAKMNFNKSTA